MVGPMTEVAKVFARDSEFQGKSLRKCAYCTSQIAVIIEHFYIKK